MARSFFGPLGDGFAAKSGEDLCGLLEGIDAQIPPRTQGRRAEHRERYAIVHSLRTLNAHGLIELPAAQLPGIAYGS